MDIKLKLYQSLVRLRHTEETLAELYKQQEMRTPTHFGIGQEAVAVGVCEALRQDDVVYSHHRCHNHYLAKGGSIEALAAELYGRETGCAKGRGGSVHLTARDKGFIASSAILGQTIAVATGSALAFKMDKSDRIAVTFFGEASCEEGIFYESLNYAALMKLPVLFVCENNGYSTESPLSKRFPEGTNLSKRAGAMGLTGGAIHSNDVFDIYDVASWWVNVIRKGGGPVFLECHTYRWREHVGPYFDHEMKRTHRSREEVESWMAKCLVKRAKSCLIESGVPPSVLTEIELDVHREVASAVTMAKIAPCPTKASLFENA